MITPTGSTPMAYYESHKNQFTHAKITFISSNVVFTDDEFESNGITVSQYMNSETDLTFGTASCVEAEINLFRSNKTDVLKWSDEFLLQFGYDDGEGGIDWFDIGYFTGTKPERTKTDVINFIAHDRMIRFDIQADDFIDSLDFTSAKTLTQIYSALCTYIGVSSVSGDEISANMAHSYSKCPIGHGYSCRDILGYIAEAAGCYAIITPAGYVKMTWYTDHTDDFSLKRDDIFAVDVSEVDWSYDASLRKKWIDLETEKWKDLERLTWRELEGYYSPTKINALNFIYSDDDVGITVPNSLSTKNVYTIINNPFLYGSTTQETTGYLTNLYNRLSAFGTYVPVKLDCVGSVFVETGDIVRLEFSDGNYGFLPVFNRVLQYNGALVCSYEATGNLDRTPISGDDKKVMEANGKIHVLRKTVDELYSEINDPNTGLSTKVSQTESNIELLAERKARVYFSDTEPVGTQDNPLNVNDLWIDTANNNQLKIYKSPIINYFLTKLSDVKRDNTSGTWNNNTYTFNGVSFTFNESNGYISSIDVSGTPSGYAFVLFSGLDLDSSVKYVLSGFPEGSWEQNNGLFIELTYGGGYGVSYVDRGTGVTFTTPSNLTYSESKIKFDSNHGSIGNKTITPLLIKEDSGWKDASFDDPEKYTVYSGVEINSDGVKITGSKNILFIAGNDEWEFSSKGMKYIDDNAPSDTSFQITNFNDRAANSSGIFTKYENGSGKIMFIPICSSVYHTEYSYWYGVFNLEIYDEPNYYNPYDKAMNGGVRTAFFPNNNLSEDIGKKDNVWKRIFTKFLCGYTRDPSTSPNNVIGEVVIAPNPENENLDKSVIFQAYLQDPNDPTSHALQIFGANSRQITYYGKLANVVTTETNLNNMKEKGQCWLNFSQVTNGPSVLQGGAYCLEVCKLSDTHLLQIIYADWKIYTRMLYNGTWGNWYMFSGTQV